LRNFPVLNARKQWSGATSAGRTMWAIHANAGMRALKGERMEYNVAAQIKISVDSPDALEDIKKSLGEITKVDKSWEEDVGFGIKMLKAVILLNDAEGGMSEMEEKIKNIPHVKQVEVENITRI